MDTIKAIAHAIMQGQGHQRPAPLPVATMATPPALPPFQPPTQSSVMPSMGSYMMAAAQAAKPQQPVPPVAAPPQAAAMPPQQGAPMPAMNPGDPAPALPPSVNIGAAPGAQPSVRQDLMSSLLDMLKKGTGPDGKPPAWAQSFGGLGDQHA